MTAAASIIGDMNAAIEAYMAAYSSHDIKRIRACVTPAFAILGETPVLCSTDDEFTQNIKMLLSIGWATSKAKVLEAYPLSESHGIMVVDVFRYRADGSELNKSRIIYLAQGVEGAWRISGSIAVAPPFTGPGGHPLP